MRSGGVVACVLAASVSAWAWGPGHDTVGRCILKKMPAEWRARMKSEWMKDYLHATHFADDGKAHEKLISAADRDWCRAHVGLKQSSYAFHDAPALFGLVDRLVNALRTGDDKATFVYVAALSHSLADPIACNHDPIIHILTYVWTRGALDLLPKTGRELPVDFVFAEFDAETRAQLDRRLAALDVPPVPSDLTPERLYAQMLRWRDLALNPAGAASQRIIENGAAWYATGDPKAKLAAADALSDLGLLAVQRTLYVFAAARQFAARADPAMPTACYDAIRRQSATNDAEVIARKLEDDSFARPYLAEPGRPSRFRVLFDTAAHMNKSCLGPIHRPLGCQTVGSLKRVRPDLNASLYSVRDFVRAGLDPKVAPYLCVFRGANGFRGFDVKAFNRRLAAYVKDGGRVVWINGLPPKDVFGAASGCLSTHGKRDGYCKPAYPVSSLDVLMKSALVWTGEGGTETWNWRRRPNGHAGWFWEGSFYVFDAAKLPADAKPILSIRSPEGDFTMGVLTPHVAYLPVCALFPYCLTTETPTLRPFRLTLDSCGEAILLKVLASFERTASGR